MNESTFPDPLVEQIVNAYYVPVQFDVEGDARLTSHYQVSDLPTILIVDDHDKVIKKFTGYYSSRRLAGSLQALANEQALT
jgi:hypothetical protein